MEESPELEWSLSRMVAKLWSLFCLLPLFSSQDLGVCWEASESESGKGRSAQSSFGCTGGKYQFLVLVQVQF